MHIFADKGLEGLRDLLEDTTAVIKLTITIALIVAVLYTMFKKHMAFGAIVGVAIMGAFVFWFVNLDGFKTLAEFFTAEGGTLW